MQTITLSEKSLLENLSPEELFKLNCIFSTWSAIGKPRNIGGKTQYFQADGHEIHSAGAIRLTDKISVVSGVLQCGATGPRNDTPCLWLAVQRYQNGWNLQLCNPPITESPLGYFWTNTTRKP